MAVQRISFIERNIDKLLVGLAGAGLLGAMVWQFAGPHATVEVGTKKDVALADAYPELAKMATNLNTQMTRKEFTDLPEGPKTSLVKDFDARLAKDVAPNPRLAWAAPAVEIAGVNKSAASGAARPEEGLLVLRPLVIDAPARPIAAAHMSTVSHAEVEAATKVDPAAAALFPAKAPHDKAAVTVQTNFDGSKLREALEADPTTPKTRKLDRSLYENIQIVRVELQRQTQAADGSWSDAASVAPMPGRVNLAPQLSAKNINAGNIGEYIKFAADNEEAILRPAYYERALLAGKPVGDEWVPPAELGGADNKAAQLAGIKRAIDGKNGQIKRIEVELTNLKTPQAPRPAGGGGGGGGGGRGGGGKVGGGGGGGGGGAAPPPKTNPNDERIKRLEEALKRLRDEVAELEKTRAELGQAKPKSRDRVFDPNLSRILQESDISIWSHDVSVERGKTYRYRVRLWFTNPLIGQAARMDAAENSVASEPAIASKESEWSAPVKVDEESYYFITSATPANVRNTAKGIPTASAGAELYTFTWGYWRKGQASLEPGDVLAARITIPDAEAIEKLAPNPAVQAPPTPMGPGGGGGGKGAGALGGPPAAPGNQPKPAPAQKTPTIDIELARDAFLVDVVTSPVTEKGSKALDYAYLRDGAGELVARRPDQDRDQADYRRLAKNAAAGDDSLKSLLEPAAGPAGGVPQPGMPVPPAPRPREAPGGGGGGGYGG